MKELETLYHLHRDALYRYLLRLTRDPALAEDLLQETFLQAMLSLGRFRGESDIRTWLFAIGRNLWLKSLRSARETADDDALLAAYDREELEETAIRRDQLARIGTLIATRDARAQQVFSLRVQGYSYAEIAQRLKISESSARVLAHRTKNWLKKQLEQEGEA